MTELYAKLFDLAPTKSQQTQVAIANAAIESFVKRGVDKTTYGDIAKAAGVSRTIVARYFPSQDDLFLFAVKIIRASYQQFVIDRFSAKKSAWDQLEAYLGAAMDWAYERPEHANAWLLFFYYCGIRKEFRKLNTEMVSMGFERMKALIKSGVESGEFEVGRLEATSRQLHLALSGAIHAMMTEEKAFHSQTRKNTIDFIKRNLIA